MPCLGYSNNWCSSDHVFNNIVYTPRCLISVLSVQESGGFKAEGINRAFYSWAQFC
ncbi:unnamed protein product [Callosobruchus maculatus]|uniref:Uncharacterized protein n=1 Tax=Callosobruchus maculatus TaxID=64391 RepID=A0A653DER5_CALMS|nr:unnamed protein product [Callosobruchus maculatus]